MENSVKKKYTQIVTYLCICYKLSNSDLPAYHIPPTTNVGLLQDEPKEGVFRVKSFYSSDCVTIHVLGSHC